MALNNRPQSSHLALRKHLDLLLSSSATTTRSSVTDRGAVPAGIVAACVHRLQSHSQSQPNASSTPVQRVSDAVDHHRGSSRTGFGRRLTNRFGPPAIQNTKPDEEPKTSDGSHTFAGLTTPRKNNHEEHAIADSGLKSRRQTHDQSNLDPSDQGVLATPNKPPSTRTFSRSIQQRLKSIDSDVLRELDASGQQSHFIAQTSIFPVASNSEDDSDMYGHEYKLNGKYTINSEKSFVTTSTIRRQSVRDLFVEYGIDKPSGLASKSTSREKESTSQNGKGICHLCSWYNSEKSGNCWRCGHKLCSKCGEDGIADYTQNPSKRAFGATKPDLPPKDPRVFEEEPVKQVHTRPLPMPMQSKLGSFDSSRKPSSILSKFPDFYEPSTPRVLSLTTHPPQKQLIDQPNLAFLSGSKTTKQVKNSPFLIADLQSPQRLQNFPASARKPESRTNTSSIHDPRNSPRVKDSQNVNDSPLCQTPRLAHHAERNIISYSGKKHRQHVHEDTDHGYVADTSFVEEGPHIESSLTERVATAQSRHQHAANASQASENIHFEWSCNHHLRRHSRSQYYSARPESHLACTPRPQKQSARVSDLLSLEFVECRGYPRTGHAPHGNSKDAGLVGECQHSFDDCQCHACQNTQHNVRCCTHPDHHAILHHHHNPRKESSVHHLVDLFSKSNPRASTELRAQSPPAFRKSNDEPVASSSEDGPIFARDLIKVTGEQQRTKKATIPMAPPLPSTKVSATVQQSKNMLGLTQNRPAFSESPSDFGAVDSGLHVGKGKPAELVMSLHATTPDASDEASKAVKAQLRHSSLNLGDITGFEQNTGKPGTDGTSASFAELRESSTFPSRKSSDVKKGLWRPLNIPQTMHSVPAPRRSSLVMPSIFFDPTDADVGLPPNQKTWESREFFTQKANEKSGSGDSMNEGSNTSPKALEIIKPVPRPSRHISSHSAAEKKLRLKLTERKFTQSGESDVVSGRKAVKGHQEHSLSDDADDATLVEESGQGACFPRVLIPDDTDNHECIWRSRFLNSLANRERQDNRPGDESMDFNIKGITIIIHLDGREDLVVKADSWDGSGFRMNV